MPEGSRLSQADMPPLRLLKMISPRYLTTAALHHLMRSLLFGVAPADPLTYGAVVVVLAFAAAIASYLPARRIMRLNPAAVRKS